LIWFGGKCKYAELIISKMPAHKKYVEVFGGAAHVIVQKPRVNHEVYNDIDGNLVNFIMTARDYPQKFQEACEGLPYSRELYERWKKEKMPNNPFEKAVRFFYLNRCGIAKGNAEEIPSTGWRHSTKSSQNPAMGYISACQLIDKFSERMKGVMIENADFRTIITKYDDTDTLFYVDPPYVGREKYYAGEFSRKDHIELAELLRKVKARVVLSYYEDPLISELYAGWHKDSFDTYKQVVNGNMQGGTAEELLYMNYDDGQLSLFD
jgi:DNA adenine methylase